MLMTALRLVVLASMLVLATPTQAEEQQGDGSEADDEAPSNGTNEPAPTDSTACQVADYSLSRPTALYVDPDRCFIPYILKQIPI